LRVSATCRSGSPGLDRVAFLPSGLLLAEELRRLDPDEVYGETLAMLAADAQAAAEAAPEAAEATAAVAGASVASTAAAAADNPAEVVGVPAAGTGGPAAAADSAAD